MTDSIAPDAQPAEPLMPQAGPVPMAGAEPAVVAGIGLIEAVPLLPLDRGALQVMRIMALLTALPALIGAVALDVFAFPMVREEIGFPPFGLLPGVIALYALWAPTIGASRAWARSGYAYTGRELHVASGWLFRRHTIVPASRVQHIDVTQGPIERAFGVATLILHTAGTQGSMVELFGVTHKVAEEIRDDIRLQIAAHENGMPW